MFVAAAPAAAAATTNTVSAFTKTILTIQHIVGKGTELSRNNCHVHNINVSYRGKFFSLGFVGNVSVLSNMK